MKVLQVTLLLSAVYSSSEGNLPHNLKSEVFLFLEESKKLERSQRSFKIGAITIQNDLDEFVRVSVQTGIQNRNCSSSGNHFDRNCFC